MVSESISLPSLGSFHLSLTVLYAIGDWYIFRLTAWSRQIPSRFHVSRCTQDTTRYVLHFVYGAITLSCVAFQPLLLYNTSPHCSPTTPDESGLVFSAFARHYWRNHYYFLFLWLLRCFTSPGIALLTYEFS